MSSELIEQATKAWDEYDIAKVRSVAWSSISYFGQRMSQAFSGEMSTTDYVHQLLRDRVKPALREHLAGVAIACGDMASERLYFEGGRVVKFAAVDGFDVSRASLDRYTPNGLAFTPHVADCNRIVLPENAYHLAVGSHGIHHIYNLGNLFYQLHFAMADGGLMFMYEWVGPEYLQIPPVNYFLSMALLWLLFPSRKVRTTHMGVQKGLWLQSKPDEFEPSEACNSSELMPQFKKYFKPIKMVLHGGLTYPIFEGIAQNIDQSKPLNRFKIQFVYHLEVVLTRMRIIKPLFVIVVAEKRDLERPFPMKRLFSVYERIRSRLKR
jgi:hypothetical protein